MKNLNWLLRCCTVGGVKEIKHQHILPNLEIVGKTIIVWQGRYGWYKLYSHWFAWA